MKVRHCLPIILIVVYDVFLVMVRVTGGEAPGGSALAPKIGPLGLVCHSMRKIFSGIPHVSISSLQKKLVMILLKQQVNGKACVSQ